MRHSALILALLGSMTLFSASPGRAWWGDKTLVTIDSSKYTTEDFKRWWKFWNDDESPLPKTADFYVDWLLLAREAEQMDLAKDPGFERSTEVFVKVRSLLRLKGDEIDSKIKVSDGEIRGRYEKLYTPTWLLQRLQFQDESTAKAAWQGLKDGTLTIDELLKRPPEEGGPTHQREDWRRPVGIDEAWSNLFKGLAVGQATEPVAYGQHFVFYRLKAKEEGTPEDFAKFREKLKTDLWKEKEEQLTQEFMSGLTKKFEVKVDEERLAAVDLKAADDSLTDAPIVTTNRRNVTERDFVQLARRQAPPRTHSASPEEEQKASQDFKKKLLKGILDQNLSDWEALDRRYQDREPFKWEYEFNVRHRLTRALEQRLFGPKATVTDQEVKAHYDANLARYSQPEMVKLVFVQDVEGDIDQVWADMATGKDFLQAVKEHTKNKGTPQEAPYNHLDPFIQKAVNRLAKGEVSPLLEDQGHRFIVRLIERTPAVPVPLEQVAESIRKKLERQKLDEQRTSYLELLKSRSKIKVGEAEWKAVRKELGGANER